MLLIKLIILLLFPERQQLANDFFDRQFSHFDVPPCRYHINLDSQVSCVIELSKQLIYHLRKSGKIGHKLGGCYSYSLCRNNYPMPHFETCEFDPRTLEYTVCCPKISPNKYDFRKESRIWTSKDSFECGVRLGNKLIMDEINRIIHPDSQTDMMIKALLIEATRSGAHPWMALIMFKNKPICGASIVSRQSLLTSAHCLIKSR